MYRHSHILLFRLHDQLRQTQSLQNAARQSAAQECALPGYHWDPALDRLHCRIETGETDRIEKDVGALKKPPKSGAVLPGNESNEVGCRQPTETERNVDALPKFV